MRSGQFWSKLSLWGLILTVQLLGLVFTFSRGPWIGTLMALAVFIALMLIFGRWRFLLRALMVLATALALASAIVFLPSAFRGEEAAQESAPGADRVAELATTIAGQVPGVGGGFGAGGLSGRTQLWKESWGLMTDHPWFEFDGLKLSFVTTTGWIRSGLVPRYLSVGQPARL